MRKDRNGGKRNEKSVVKETEKVVMRGGLRISIYVYIKNIRQIKWVRGKE